MSNFSRYLVLTIIAVLLGATTACAPTPEQRGTGEVIDDAGITTRVKTALLKEEGLRAFTINVTTSRGEVQLSGFLPNEDLIRRAVAAARSVPSVKAVHNGLKVTPPR